jgi:hypothetical protein
MMYRAVPPFFAAWLCVSLSHAQPLMTPVPESNDLQEEILNGKPAVARDWRATVQFESAGGFCTSTIVGEKVILTASHCVPNNSKARVLFNNTLVTVTCNHHSQYKGDSCLTAATWPQIAGCTADVALCVTDKDAEGRDVLFPMELTSGEKIKFETVNTDPALVKKNDKVVLLGYGCTMAGGAVSAILRVGSATVTSTPVPGASANPDNTKQEFLIAEGGSAVCKGDSGGADFNVAGANRKVIAVNSRGNLSSISYLTSTSDGHIVDFLKSWSGPPRNAEICGVTPGAKNCR